jgi:hypothetical protein
MNKIKITCATIIAALTMYSCTNKNAEFNNAIFDVHNEFQNNVKTLEEKLAIDSLTKDSAVLYLATAKSNCEAQYALLKKITPAAGAVQFQNAVDSLLAKQLNSITLQQKMFDLNEENDEYVKLESMLEAQNVIVDSLDVKVKQEQVAFAKKNNFKLQ